MMALARFRQVGPVHRIPGGKTQTFTRRGGSNGTGGGLERGQARPLWPRARPGSPSQPASRAGPGMRYSYMPPM